MSEPVVCLYLVHRREEVAVTVGAFGMLFLILFGLAAGISATLSLL